MIEVFTDGASKGNPGPSGAGVYIKANGNTYTYAFPLGIMTNHEAEFAAVEKALDICTEKFPNEIVALQSDAQIVVDAIEKQYVKNPLFKVPLRNILTLITGFPYVFIKWIPNKQNKHADRLAKQAIHQQE